MFERRSLKLPITLGVVMIVLVVVLTVGWVLITVVNATRPGNQAGVYWALLSVGATISAFILVGVVIYLILSIKAVNLSQRQSNFIDSVTHELKSPIASLKLCLQTLNRRQLTPEEQQGFHKYMLEDIERLDTLINHLLDAARLDRSADPEEYEDVPLADILRRIADEVCLRYQVAPETVELALLPCYVRARPMDVEVIFRNLVDNAVKYGDDHEPRVQVTMSMESPGRVLVQVTDNGKGIPAKLRRKIFGRFVRLGSELEREKPGTGLGLYIVRTLVSRLEGKVRVHDLGQQTGTTFEVSLPGRAIEESVETEASTRSPLALGDGKSFLS
jgi:two-component system, OmpR family, phosphate regulon sensor histidine kinase PhoR